MYINDALNAVFASSKSFNAEIEKVHSSIDEVTTLNADTGLRNQSIRVASSLTPANVNFCLPHVSSPQSAHRHGGSTRTPAQEAAILC